MTSTVPKDATLVNPASPFSAGNPAFLVTATTTGAAHTLHTAVAGTDDVDAVHLWAQNIDGSSAVALTLEVGGVSLTVSVQRQATPLKVLDGIPINSANTVKAYAGLASKIVVLLKVIRMTDATA